jgi:magnesium and cobalt transporter
MTPRSQIVFFPEDMPLDDMVAHFRRTRHTKVPVFRKAQRDTVVGILYARDLLGQSLKKLAKKPKRLWSLLREPLFVSEFKSASDLFHTFRKRKQSLALAVDEYGGVTGLITMEDLLEVIFGEIQSPSELQAQTTFETLPDGSLQVDATMPLADFNRAFGQKFVAENVETIGGLILGRVGVLPSEGTQITLGKLEVRVLEIRYNRIESLSIRKLRREKAAKHSAPAGESAEITARVTTPAIDTQGNEAQSQGPGPSAEEK